MIAEGRPAKSSSTPMSQTTIIVRVALTMSILDLIPAMTARANDDFSMCHLVDKKN